MTSENLDHWELSRIFLKFHFLISILSGFYFTFISRSQFPVIFREDRAVRDFCFLFIFYLQFQYMFRVSMLRVFTWMGRGEGRRGGEGEVYRAKSSPLPLTSLCVSSPTHTLPNTGYLKIPFPKCIETSSQIAMAIRVEWKKPLKFSMVKKLPNFEPN